MMQVKVVLRSVVLLVVAAFLVGLWSSAARAGEDCDSARVYFKQAVQMSHPANDVQALMAKEQLYRQAITVCPGYAEAHNNLADVYEHLGRYADTGVALPLSASLSRTGFSERPHGVRHFDMMSRFHPGQEPREVCLAAPQHPGPKIRTLS